MAKKELILEGMNCASCASKIEEQVKALEGVTSATVNLALKSFGKKLEKLRLSVGAAIFAVALLFKFPFMAESVLYSISYILVGGEVLLKSVRNITRGQVFDENFLMSIATLGAFAIRQFPEAVAVMLF